MIWCGGASWPWFFAPYKYTYLLTYLLTCVECVNTLYDETALSWVRNNPALIQLLAGVGPVEGGTGTDSAVDRARRLALQQPAGAVPWTTGNNQASTAAPCSSSGAPSTTWSAAKWRFGRLVWSLDCYSSGKQKRLAGDSVVSLVHSLWKCWSTVVFFIRLNTSRKYDTYSLKC